MEILAVERKSFATKTGEQGALEAKARRRRDHDHAAKAPYR